MYIEYEYYKTLYGDKALAENEFNRLSWDAEREIDKATCGIDGVKKLKVAFPTNRYDAEVVKRCVCDLIDFLSQLEKATSSFLTPSIPLVALSISLSASHKRRLNSVSSSALSPYRVL